MKFNKTLVLCLVLSAVSVLWSGCVVNAFTHLPPPAGVEVTNNLRDKVIVLSTTRDSGPVARIATGQSAHVAVCGLPPGSYFTITAKVYDQGGRYLGMVENQSSVYFDAGGRFNSTWVVNYFNQAN